MNKRSRGKDRKPRKRWSKSEKNVNRELLQKTNELHQDVIALHKKMDVVNQRLVYHIRARQEVDSTS